MSRQRRPAGVLKTALAVTVALSAWIQNAAAANILRTTGFTTCGTNANVTVQEIEIEYNSDSQTVTFNVAGTSTKEQNVTAKIDITAYGAQVYSRSLNPCATGTYVQQLCPAPVGQFSASGSQVIPAAYASVVPSIAFRVPDISAQATLRLVSVADGSEVACVQAEVTNDKTVDQPAVSYAAAGLTGAALLISGVSAVGAAMAGGSGAAGGSAAAGGIGTLSPGFTEVFGLFQGMAMNGMLSVNYPQVYRSFSKNFAFSTGLVPWTQLQTSIDNFRAATGGNLTDNSVAYLRNKTLVYSEGSSSTAKRAVHARGVQVVREIATSVNGSSTSTTTAITKAENATEQSFQKTVSGIKAFVEELSIPSANTFMTVLLIVAIVVAVITVGLLFFKVVLEVWSLVGRFPESLTPFRKHYWRSIGQTLTTLVLLLYGVWVLYCMYQFTRGDSWAVKLLAGLTLATFTGILAFFTFQIGNTAKKLQEAEGDVGGLFENKRLWDRYSMFYESYRRRYWWIFLPTILYMFVKGVVLAVGDGHGLAQTVSQMLIEIGMLALLCWSRPYERRSGNVINIMIQVVRVLSIVCVFIFVDEFDIAETTQTVAGVVLIVVQSVLSAALAILMGWNALIACIKENPHKKRQREIEEARDNDALTPLDARNSLLQPGRSAPMDEKNAAFMMTNMGDVDFANSGGDDKKRQSRLSVLSSRAANFVSGPLGVRRLTPTSRLGVDTEAADNGLLGHAAPIAQSVSSTSFSARQPILANAGFDFNGPSRAPPRRNDSRTNNPYAPFASEQQVDGGYQSNTLSNNKRANGPWQSQRDF
ncbi:duf907 domain containing protein [Grosmannia clavigera kw1407]|uniref:Duf907 domain containing protein n=1 Tax=Grosmannia clavigera (strain kw1407 / UAMH 11150) TaxID=655863 RepID=F0X9D6_GROCL|nr:duf907 domain containing protein [Grosmannia clavigera kw1407]EFX05588.1 duf907 domain containing protein [Grosmannia clavigera kw1407]